MRNILILSYTSFLSQLFDYLLKYSLNNKYNSNSQKIVIVFVNAIGDFILFSSILNGLRKQYKDYEITLIGFNRWECLTRNINFVKYIPFDRNKFFRNPVYIFKFIHFIKKEKYKVAFYPSYSRMFIGDVLMKILRAEEKIAYDGDTNNISLKLKKKNNENIYTNIIRKHDNVYKELDLFHNFALNIGIERESLGNPTVWLTEKEEKEADLLLEHNKVSINKNFVVIAPGAASTQRVWDLYKYAEICNYLEKNDFQILVIGSALEKKYAKEIQNLLKFKLIDLTGKTNLLVLSVLIKKAFFYLGSDSGLSHLSVAVNTPTISILGGGHPYRFFPYGDLNKNIAVVNEMECFGCNWQCIYDEAKCIKDIPTSKVIQAIDTLINFENNS